ncbi:hypothetical protein CW362_06520 [Streptomyces populi]|uniref:Uncharacterized protein n=1 Tax=Streptomyces populi TaxID=2058924 RepID=A0A2I0SUU2_9ACTN|nr:hypothetical protein [Streptomyces populi]PKT73707.1 hypothetical protein CW362_06520 [Streptomyces populi]
MTLEDVRKVCQRVGLAGPAFTRADGPAFTAYREALHACLKGAEPEAAALRASWEAEKAEG